MPTLDEFLGGVGPEVSILKFPGPVTVVGRMYSFFSVVGLPTAASASSAGLAGEALTSYIGQIPFINAPVDKQTYLARLLLQSTVAGQWLVCDRLWHNSAINLNTTASQTINSVAFPARDNNGAVNGEGVYIGLEITTATAATSSTATLTYTNSENTGGRSSLSFMTLAASSAIGTFYPFLLQGTDKGVRSIQEFQLGSAISSGAASLVAYRVIGRLGVAAVSAPFSLDLVSGGPQKAYNDTVPFLVFIPSGTTSSTVVGHLLWTVA